MTYFKDFTEDKYRELIRKVLEAGFKFKPFPSVGCKGKHVLWRHDIDMSPHRAARLAKIEYEEGIQSTYFLHLHSSFYNLFEEDVVNQINEITYNQHFIGLHYDPAFYCNTFPEMNAFDMVETEKDFIWTLFGVRPTAVSFHNPSIAQVILPTRETVAGMVNAWSDYIRNHYTYYSDSNGIWFADPLESLLPESEPCEMLHILTHPEWWTPEPTTPRKKVERAVEGRKNYTYKMYDELMMTIHNENIK